jgi:uncharacterized protein (UPF0264 family)
VTSATRVAQLLSAGVRGARAGKSLTCSVVGVAYADLAPATSIDFKTLVKIAARTHASGVLVDTALKSGPGLLHLVSPAMLRSWVSLAHDEGLSIALAGKLTADDLPLLQDTGADIVGVRGAACDRGRTSHVVEKNVRALRRRLRQLTPGDRSHTLRPPESARC